MTGASRPQLFLDADILFSAAWKVDAAALLLFELAAALLSGASLLVTGDRRDFGHLYGKRIEGVKVVGLGMAIERVISTKQRSSQNSNLKKN